MTDPEPHPTPLPPCPPFQFTLRTLLLLFVVLGSSLAVFGAWGLAVFGLVVGLAVYLRRNQVLVVALIPRLTRCRSIPSHSTNEVP